MAYAPSSPATMESNPQQSQDHNPTSQSNLPNPPPAPTPPPPSLQSLQPSQSLPNPTPNLTPVPPMPPLISYVPPPASGVTAAAVPPSTPSFRPVSQFSPIPNFQNPTLQIPGVQPPGVGFAAATASAAAVPISVPVPPQPLMPYQVPPGQLPNSALRPPYAPMANGYTAVPGALPQGTIPPPGLSHFPSPYSTFIRPAFPPRPPGAIGVLPRPPVPGIPGVRPIITPIIRPAISSVTPAEEPQTTVYVGKIAATVENDFMLSVLQFCGPVKSWKRPQDSTGTLRGFGFCEFESAEGVLRALRLLSKFSIDGQELVLNVKQATRDFLKRYVEKKIENSKNVKAAEASPATKEDESAASDEKTDPPKLTAEEPKKEDNDLENKEDDDAKFGIVTDEDREADREAMEKLTSMIEERLKTKPLPPPPPAQASGDGTGNSNAELPAKSKDGDFDADIRNDAGEEKNDEELTSENKQESENDRAEISSPDKNRRKDRRSRDRDRERDLKREKEREIERYERETERERIRKEREQRRRMEDAERQYEEYLKDWEYREREKEKQRQYEKEREKERERKRKKEIIYEEEDEDDDSRKRWRRSVLEEKRKKRLREKEDDLIDRQKEDEDIAEAKRRAEEEKQRQQERDLLKNSSDHLTNGTDKAVLAEEASAEIKDKAMEQDYEGDSVHENRIVLQNGGTNSESTMAPVAASDMQHSGNVTTKKLGFGLVGSGKRTAVPAVFNEEDDDDAHKEKKMRPLVPIDYSTEELQAVQPTSSGATPNLIAAAEFAKRISHTGFKDEKPDAEKERSRRTKDRNDGTKEKTHDATDREHGLDRVKTKDNKKLLDAKQLIDMIPKTKNELFSYEINWAVYDEHALHERMRPWISKKITEFLGEEEATLVDYIVSGTQEHVEADRMLQLLQSILDEEAEMFVLKMWRMLIFEIKKVETGLSSRSRA